MADKNKVLIANGQGFWGDSILGPVRLVKEGPLDYLTLDYLAEVTMSIMQKLRSRRPEMGYATDFVKLIERIAPELVEKDIKVVANAGGVNPHACKDAVLAVLAKQGFSGVKVAVVEGDDILDQLDDLLAQGEELKNMDTGAPLASVRERVSSANVYLGAFPIAEALDQREHGIAGQIDEANRSNEEAKRLLAEHQSRLDGARDEVKGLLEQARRDAESQKQQIVIEAQQAAQAEKERAVREIGLAKNQALQDLAERSVDTAVNLAGQIVRRQLTPDDHADLIKSALPQLPRDS